MQLVEIWLLRGGLLQFEILGLNLFDLFHLFGHCNRGRLHSWSICLNLGSETVLILIFSFLNRLGYLGRIGLHQIRDTAYTLILEHTLSVFLMKRRLSRRSQLNSRHLFFFLFNDLCRKVSRTWAQACSSKQVSIVIVFDMCRFEDEVSLTSKEGYLLVALRGHTTHLSESTGVILLRNRYLNWGVSLDNNDVLCVSVLHISSSTWLFLLNWLIEIPVSEILNHGGQLVECLNQSWLIWFLQ